MNCHTILCRIMECIVVEFILYICGLFAHGLTNLSRLRYGTPKLPLGFCKQNCSIHYLYNAQDSFFD